jgi:hypothetical protein
MKVKIVKNPVGRYNLSYEIGEVVNLPDSQAKEMIEDGYAEASSQPLGHVTNVKYISDFDKAEKR